MNVVNPALRPSTALLLLQTAVIDLFEVCRATSLDVNYFKRRQTIINYSIMSPKQYIIHHGSLNVDALKGNFGIFQPGP